MREKIKRLMHKKYFHLCMMIVIIAVILFTLGIFILQYSVNGETNMPFSLTKIAIISSSEGQNKQIEGNRWAFDISQNNDIFLYVEKNKFYSKQEVIEKIIVDNITVEKLGSKGEIHFYKPELDGQKKMFVNVQNNQTDKIEYVGDMQSDIKQMKIANQGGLVAFRYANDNIAEYKSNEDEINHNELLKKSNVTEDDIKAKLNFELIIVLHSGKEYKANISLDMPVTGVTENGVASTEITNLKDVVFKRTKN